MSSQRKDFEEYQQVNNFICLNCNESASSLFRHTEGKFIKLVECKNCGDVVDHYVECERSIIVTDLIMQELAAYKHSLHNSSDFSPQFYLKLALSIVLSEGYIRWTANNSQLRETLTIRNNEYFYYIICLSTVIELISFSLVLFVLLPEKNTKTPKMLSKAIILGQIGRLLNIPAIIYKQSSSLFFQAFILVFVFVSTVQSVRAITFKGRVTTGIDVGAAISISFILSKVFQGFLL